jgi:hypothetical protein
LIFLVHPNSENIFLRWSESFPVLTKLLLKRSITTEGGSEGLAHFKQITWLDLEGTTDSTFSEEISQLARLEALGMCTGDFGTESDTGLNNTPIVDDKCLKNLSKLTNLERLYLNNCRQVTARGNPKPYPKNR